MRFPPLGSGLCFWMTLAAASAAEALPSGLSNHVPAAWREPETRVVRFLVIDR